MSDLLSGAEELTWKLAAKIILFSAFLVCVAMASSALALFTANDFDKVAEKMPKKYRLPLFVALSCILLTAVAMDYVWNYKPIVAATH
ncbi:hypothetical protein D9M71_676790 [compost metagenome]